MGFVRSIQGLAGGTALVAFISASSAFAGNALSAFGPGEQSMYRVAILGQAAGTLSLTVGERTPRFEVDVLPVVVLTRTNDLMGKPLLHYELVSYWDPGRSICLGNEMTALEHGRWRRERIRVNPATARATVLKEKQGERARRSTLQVGEGALDIVSAVLTLRNAPLIPGQTFAYPVFSGTDAFTLTGVVEARELLPTAFGPQETVRVRMKTRFTGKAASKRDLVVWFTTDSRRLPIRAETEFLFGAVRAELTRHEGGQRYPLHLHAAPRE